MLCSFFGRAYRYRQHYLRARMSALGKSGLEMTCECKHVVLCVEILGWEELKRLSAMSLLGIGGCVRGGSFGIDEGWKFSRRCLLC